MWSPSASWRTMPADGGSSALLGPALGHKLAALAWNRDPREIKTQRRSHSAGAQSALGRKPAEERVFRPDATPPCRQDRHPASLQIAAGTDGDRARALRAICDSVTRSRNAVERQFRATRMLAEVAEALVHAALADHPQERVISLLAISVSNLEEDPFVNSTCRSVWKTSRGDPDRSGAWREGWPTARSMLFEIASDGRRSVMDRSRWAAPAIGSGRFPSAC